MTAFAFSERSKKRLVGVHPDLIAVMGLAIARSPIDFTVLEGTRTLARQRKLVAEGASKTMNSRHLTGHAVDIAPLSDGEVSWDWPLYHKLAPVVKAAADELGVDLEWGGDWRTFKDGPHWQLSWNTYDKNDMTARANTAPQPALPPIAPRPSFDPAPVAPQHAGHASTPRESVDQTMTAFFAKVQKWLGAVGLSVPLGLQFVKDLDPQVQVALLAAVAVVGGGGIWVLSSLIRRERLKHFLAGVK